jgi:hypothetical protein
MTEVSSRARANRSGTIWKLLVDYFIHIGSERHGIDRGGVAEHSNNCAGWNKPVTPQRP